ncbi:uncharacterized protein BJ212DRAFT_1303726 [Suillus subaureus]|uniref:Uncharacterized protein n=1 Tax=Suillus subaureus TaxID=48587 RepID=A0A9P7DYE8_9AGAM|nr:uncharacterized protein BJ212DRAFT_1303726 [Suillus subaureus]KAG1806212.1 hypothetical protein BJ212DRAFT_1303726 [Suillus subaureus]
MDTSRVLDMMLRNTHQTGGEKSERYTACAICACPEIYKQVDLMRTWFMYLLWPFDMTCAKMHSTFGQAIDIGKRCIHLLFTQTFAQLVVNSVNAQNILLTHFLPATSRCYPLYLSIRLATLPIAFAFDYANIRGDVQKMGMYACAIKQSFIDIAEIEELETIDVAHFPGTGPFQADEITILSTFVGAGSPIPKDIKKDGGGHFSEFNIPGQMLRSSKLESWLAHPGLHIFVTHVFKIGKNTCASP